MTSILIRPFQAVHPPAGDAIRVASVPYDVITRSEASIIATENEDSFIRVIRSEVDFPEDVSPYDPKIYTRARENYDRLLQEGMLEKDTKSSVYLYRQCIGDRYQVGIVACCHVDDYNKHRIRKHEKTREVKENDRTNHVLGMHANTGPVFLTYRGHPDIDSIIEDEMITRPMFHFVASDGVTHTGWRIDDETALLAAFAHVDTAYVADGHHRIASAARAAKVLQESNPNHDGSEEYNRFLAVLFPASQLHILPYNRTVSDLHGHSPEAFLAALKNAGTLVSTNDPTLLSAGSFCMYMGKEHGGWFRLDLDPQSIDTNDPIASLDVELLQQRVLSPILGIGDPRSDTRIDFVGGIHGSVALEHHVDNGNAAVAFSLCATTIDQLLTVADAQLIMPPKSTWFEPKLCSGLFVHELN